MIAHPIYNQRVLDYFFKPVHAGQFSEDEASYQVTLCSPQDGRVVVLSVRVNDDNKVEKACFLAYGDPVLIALCEHVCCAIENKPIAQSRELMANHLVEQLDLSRDFLTTALFVEDVIKAL